MSIHGTDGTDGTSPGDAAGEGDVPTGGPLRFAQMTGSSIAGPDAAPWVTDFLNAAYYRRPVGERDVADLRVAFGVLTTYWYRNAPGRRLHVTDLRAFHRAFGGDRFSTERSARGTLSPLQLLEGADVLLDDGFAEAYADDARRGWGIAFATADDRAAYDHAARMRLARLGPLTPGVAAADQQAWHTYPPVAMPSSGAVTDALMHPETWPDHATESGRFTPLRPGGLAGQTFEIEVAAGTDSALPVFTRGYVTVTRVVTSEDPGALEVYVADLETGLARYGHDEPRAVPAGATALVGLDLTTHQGHFMGSGHNRLLLYEHDGASWVRAAGTWDPMPWHVERAYRLAGEEAQHAFWGQGAIERMSMLHQLAKNLTAA